MKAFKGYSFGVECVVLANSQEEALIKLNANSHTQAHISEVLADDPNAELTSQVYVGGEIRNHDGILWLLDR